MDQTAESLVHEIKQFLSINEADLWKIASGECKLRKKIDELKLRTKSKLKIEDDKVAVDMCTKRKPRPHRATTAVRTPKKPMDAENDEVSRMFDKICSSMEEYELQLKKLIGNRIELRAHLDGLAAHCVPEQNSIHQETVEPIEFHVEYKKEGDLLAEQPTNINNFDSPNHNKLSERVPEINQAIRSAETKSFECDICKLRNFSSKDSIRRHMCKQHKSIPNDTHAIDPHPTYQCDECGKMLTQKGNLKFHLLRHFGHLPFSCPKCDKQFNQSSALKYHMAVHTNERPFPCHLCPKRFRGGQRLKNHLKTHSNRNMVARLCTVCGKSFVSPSGYERHMKAHTGIRDYACTLCPKTFLNASALNHHVKLHKGDIEKTVSCDMCPRTFVYQSQLRKHQVIHGPVNERPYACTICERRFSFSAVMRRHLLTHSGKKNHFCNLCGRGFISPFEMIVHRRIHTGERPFSCSICERTFADKRNMVKHMKGHK